MSWITTKLLAYVSGALLLVCMGLYVALRLARAELAEVESKHALAYAEAVKAQQAAERQRDNLAAAIADETEREAREASQQTQAQASEARERIRTVIREVPVPRVCSEALPEAVQNELHTAIDRANEANR